MGRNQETNQKIQGERQERNLSGALELFALNVFSATKISDIARHTSMSNDLIYHYFSSKEEIFTELVKIAFERLVSACQYLKKMKLTPHEKLHFANYDMLIMEKSCMKEFRVLNCA